MSVSLLSDRISSAIEASHGFEPRVFCWSQKIWRSSVRANPFPEAESEPKTLHLFFLASVPESPNSSALEATKSGSERFVLTDGVFHLHTPDGIGRSKLAANAERLLGVPVTARNWRTVCKTLEMANRDG